MTKSREARIDAEAFAKVSFLTTKQVYTIGKADQKITGKSLVDKLKERFSDGVAFDWQSLGRESGCFFRGIPQVGFMHGPLEVEMQVKQKQKRQRIQKEVHEVEKPEMMRDGEGTAEDSKDKSREALRNVEDTLKKACNCTDNITGRDVVQPVGAFNFLVNPDSFSQTVENIFSFSFLVKDSWAGIGLDPSSGLPVVRPTNQQADGAASASASAESGGATRVRQAVLPFSMADWDRIKSSFEIKQSMLPHRSDDDDNEADTAGSSRGAGKRKKKRRSRDETGDARALAP